VGRTEEEVDDAIARARKELEIHNPALFEACEDTIYAWLHASRPVPSDDEDMASVEDDEGGVAGMDTD
jgi:hypothetical protein